MYNYVGLYLVTEEYLYVFRLGSYSRSQNKIIVITNV